MKRYIPTLSAVFILAVLAYSNVSAQPPAWDKLAEGLEVTMWSPGIACEQVPPLYMLKIDPDRFRFAVYRYRDEKLETPLTIDQWHERTKAVALFNAGLFMDDFSYLGLLYAGGKSVGSKRHPQWHGLFVAEPFSPTGHKARVLDLRTDVFDEDKPAYQEAAQSLMLLDRRGNHRVRQSGKLAQQTVVAEDRSGHLLVVMSKGEVSLWELATCLRDGLGEVSHAMAMDGGASSDLLIGSELAGARTDALWQPLVNGNGLSHIPLPAVIGVFPRR